ncbi:MAG: hypothetical protein ACYS1C_08100 [Planctomycetota bacterium]
MPPSFEPFESLTAALDGPRSACFGLTEERRPRHSASHYGAEGEDLTFDVSNNRILCSISSRGLLENACILTGVAPATGDRAKHLRGCYVQKELIGGGPWGFAVASGGAAPVSLHEMPGVGVDLLGNVFPLFTYRHGSLRLRLLAFAPMSTAKGAAAPRAVIVVLQAVNEGAEAGDAVLLAPERVPDVAQVAAEGGAACEAVTCLDGTAREPGWPALALRAEPGQCVEFSLAFLLGESAGELGRTAELLRERTTLEWLNETWRYHAERLGRLAIPDEPFYAEQFVRLKELCRQSVIRAGDGSFGGGFWGSNFHGASLWHSPLIWLKDNYHAMLPMSLLEPRLCADSILFFVRWGVPPQPHGRGVERFPDPRRVTHSLANSLAPLLLAAAYYEATADRAFFRDHAEILPAARCLLDDVLASRCAEPFLFPSMYVSDGDARGDFHTGSNVVVWRAFHGMARVAREAYEEPGLADEWLGAAAKVREEILRHCVGGGPLGRQFFEGANADGTFVPGHDGEETDTTLMPFYGFCEPDDPAILNHARLALSPHNPLYAAGVDGIWWLDGESRHGATFPAWTTALAGASTEGELHEQLERIRRLTDHDGSIWWWPYEHGCDDLERVVRRGALEVGKCGWAAGVYLCLFVNNVLGLSVDIPERRVSLRPFCPWPEFTWKGCRLGSGLFDFRYRRQDARVIGEIANGNEDSFQGIIELMLPAAGEVAACQVNGQPSADVEHTQRYGRPAVKVADSIPAGGTLRLELGPG